MGVDIDKLISHLDLSKPILLVGCDGAGKTTIANKLKEKLGWDIAKPYKIADDAIDALMVDMKTLTKNELIIDRSCIIDGYVYNGLTSNAYSDIDEQLSKSFAERFIVKDYNIIYVTADNNDIKQRLTIRGDTYLDIILKHIDHIKFKYSYLLSHLDTYNNQPAALVVDTSKGELYEI